VTLVTPTRDISLNAREILKRNTRHKCHLSCHTALSDQVKEMIIPKIRKFNRGRPNSLLRRQRQYFGDYDTIDMEEAASILGKSARTLQRWRAIGYGPSFKLDSRYVSYSRTEVEAWKAEHDLKRTPSACLSASVQLTSGHSEA
jgi:predicted DNA-binding transcriptional regulator AlpA